MEDVRNGETVCLSCGLVGDRILDESGAPVYPDDVQPSRPIGLSEKTTQLKKLVQRSNLREAAKRSRDDSQNIRDFYDDAFSRVGITVPGFIVDTAVALFWQAASIHREERNYGLAIACLSEAGKNHQIPFDIALLSRVFSVSDRLGYDGLHELINKGLAAPMPTENVYDVATVFSERLQIPPEIRAKIQILARKIETLRKSNRMFRPCRTTSLASGCIWHIILGEHLNRSFTRDRIQHVTGTSKTTFNLVHSCIKKTNLN
jgi:transcription initiation factor TFIIIB Brf1 subunit/transcription initiation factor TFIIB